MVLAPVGAAREDELRRLLASMTGRPGQARPDNAVVPFGEFPTLHFARFVLLEDRTLDDIRVYGIPPRKHPLCLAFLGDVDGDPDAFLEELARRAAPGLGTVFSCCEGFSPGSDLAGWMRSHRAPAAAQFVNWQGRTVRRIREEAALREALQQHVRSAEAEVAGRTAREAHAALRRLVAADLAAGRLTLSPELPTPLGWRIRDVLHLVGVPLVLLLASPLLLVVAALFLVRLRRMEKTDPEICPRTDPVRAHRLAALEDHDVTNQFSAMGSLKPGFVRLWTTRFALLVVDWGARHLYTRGRLARVRTIHFARWVFLNDRQRVIFLSNYDGSLESYMDDFINKVGFGLNLAFGNGVGYPRTRWLVGDGCADERKFKEYLRRHQLPTEAWYKAYPGLTAVDLERNGLVRKGLESVSPSEREARDWLGLL
jgi:hypothetical protein